MTVILLSAALGFFAASLIALFLAPPLWRHAVRLTTKRLHQVSPRMMDEGHADRDQMRAEFALTTRKMEVKIDQLKEDSAKQLIELSRVEKKSDRQQGKIESLQAALDKRDSEIEGLSAELNKLNGSIGKKSEQIANQTDRLKRQTEMLNAQAAALDENSIELENRHGAISEYKQKEIGLLGEISQQKEQLDELQEIQKEIKSSQTKINASHKSETRQLAKDLKAGLEEISILKKNLESREHERIQLRQELDYTKTDTAKLRKQIQGKKENIADLRKEVQEKEVQIRQLNLEMLSSAKLKLKPPTRNDDLPAVKVGANKRAEEIGPEPVENPATPVPNITQLNPKPKAAVKRSSRSAALTAKSMSNTLLSPLPPPHSNTNNTAQSTEDIEAAFSKRRRPTNTHRSARTAQSAPPKVQSVKSSEPPSLAERIRALQSDHPKSL